ncbi:hypothetical protein C8R45DRAFT_1219736 [Mycena sanguinolenta]|nr:hypothetical protein C8R45DRAFT_1219736 [Mycena sanguinolenta]
MPKLAGETPAQRYLRLMDTNAPVTGTEGPALWKRRQEMQTRSLSAASTADEDSGKEQEDERNRGKEGTRAKTRGSQKRSRSDTDDEEDHTEEPLNKRRTLASEVDGEEVEDMRPIEKPERAACVARGFECVPAPRGTGRRQKACERCHRRKIKCSFSALRPRVRPKGTPNDLTSVLLRTLENVFAAKLEARLEGILAVLEAILAAVEDICATVRSDTAAQRACTGNVAPAVPPAPPARPEEVEEDGVLAVVLGE